jgi:hypothetical protein
LGGSCSTHGVRNLYNILVQNLKGREQSEDLGVDGKIRTDLKERELESVHWIYLAQDRVQWRAVVNKVINLRLP